METQLIHARIDKDGTPILVLPEAPANPGNCLIYAHIGQHSEASRAYLAHHTAPADTKAPQVLALAREWANQPPRCRVAFINHY